MGVKVQDLLDETQPAQVQVGGSAVGLECRVLWEEQFDETVWERLGELKGRDYFVEVLPRMLVSWELQDADGQPIPVTREAIEQHHVPTRFLRLAEKAALEVQEQGPLGKGSDGSLPATSPPAAA